MSQNQQFNTITLLGGIVGQIGCLVVFLIGVSLGLGMLVDRILGTDGIFTVILMVGSVPVTLFLVIRVSMSAASRVQEQIEKQMEEQKSMRKKGEA